MWIVRVALDRPYTFIVLALLIFRGKRREKIVPHES